MLPNTGAASHLPQTLNSGSQCASRHILIQSSQPPHEKGTNSIYTSSIRTGLREGRPPAQCHTARKRLQHCYPQTPLCPKALNAQCSEIRSLSLALQFTPRNFTTASHTARQTCSTYGYKLNSGTAQQVKAFAVGLGEQFDPQSPRGGKRAAKPLKLSSASHTLAVALPTPPAHK